MSPLDYVYLAIIIVCLLLSASFSASDMVYSCVSQSRLEKDKSKASKKALKLAENYDNTIATILFGNDFVNVLASSLTALLFIDIFRGTSLENMAETIGALSLLFVLLLFGEITPKAIAKNHSFFLSRFFAGYINVLKIIFFPFVWPSTKIAEWISSPFLEKAGEESKVASDEELEAMVNAIEDEGLIDEDQSELLLRSLDFKETSCYEIMTPRVKIFGYDTDSSFEEFLKRKGVFDFSRIIVYKGDLDHVLGYLPVKTLLREMVKGTFTSYESLIMPIVSVPRTMVVSSVMELMKENRHHIALVRDEFGGTEGIITLEDILEELVGEMWDENDRPSTSIIKGPKRNTFIVKGDTNIDDFYNYFGLDPDKLLEDDYSTVSGWVVDKLGRFAEVGDVVSNGPIKLTVTKCKEYTVTEALVRWNKKKPVITDE